MRIIRGLLIGAAISTIAASLATWLPASASPLSGPPPGRAGGGLGTPAATHMVSAAAQRAALAFWTPQRMKAATGVGRASLGIATPDVPATPVAPRGTPTATKFTGVKTVGALFYTTGSKAHFCTASVVNSTVGHLVLTAAHCVYSTAYAANIAYVPGYHSGTRPYGTWAVRAINVASGWRTAHDPNLDFAFLAVAPLGGKNVQAITGGLTLGVNLSYAHAIEVIGYNDTDALPVRCATQSFEFRPGQQEFYCHDFRGGTSGGPWISSYNASTGTGVVRGVIGGYEEGGYYEWASYSAHFGAAIQALFWYAERAG